MTLANILIATDFACGGIVITILNSKQIIWNPRFEGSVDGHEHRILKYLKNFDKNVKLCKSDVWYHTHEETIPLRYNFNKKLIITTENIESRYIIFLRCHKFVNPEWIENDTMESIDKIRELAKEYAIPRIIKSKPNYKTLELIDLINDNHEIFDTNNSSWKEWKLMNAYLYRENKWLRQRFDEAVWEKENQQLYKYT
jgi:hypothetical protein|tara:strand:- start:6 stop:599 length:594 start_codon:yes stop_codon:yes gene_type:complete